VIHLFINGNMAVSCDHHCVIEKLLQTPFSSLSYGDKLKINLMEIYILKYKLAHGILIPVYMRLFHGCVGVIN
jgi:hypothetical protein